MQEYYHMDKTREVGGGGASHGDAGDVTPPIAPPHVVYD